MALINFKSVGIESQTVQQTAAEIVQLPIGIKTPLELDASGKNFFVMNYELENQIADNLRNLLQTNWGERLGHFFFGANLRPLTTEFVSQDNFDSEAVVRIKSAVSKWMPFVDLVDFISEVDRLENKSTGIIKINITYNIPNLQVYGKKIQTVLYVM